MRTPSFYEFLADIVWYKVSRVGPDEAESSRRSLVKRRRRINGRNYRGLSDDRDVVWWVNRDNILWNIWWNRKL
jgi:hypothetical protein